ncbi:porin family protein [Kinneretia aquatilis]|uniref:porin family protein n=1 Tax=Kinneretia aquatilis TaxID=2070761 RepID=UPI001495333B|nr:porin family protein [Paucibacter aquatile]WIV98079.1 porin family protein [Paucibacter aquatile]
MKKTIAMAAMAMICGGVSAAEVSTYLGGDFGSSKLELNQQSETTSSFGATLGYRFNEYLAVELKAQRLGNWSLDGANYRAGALKASVLGILPVSQHAHLFGRIGYGRNTLEASAASSKSSLSRSQLLVGAGLSYQFSPQWSARFELNHQGDQPIRYSLGQARATVSQYSLGLNYAI